MQIFVENQQLDLAIDAKSVMAVVQYTLEKENSFCDELTIHFVDKKTISALHEQFFNDPTETDCITLPIDEPGTKPYCLLGEVFVCPQVGIDYASAHHGEIYREVTLYVIHGILHLLGYDDIDPTDRKKMREAEKRVLKHLEAANITLTSPS